jgi:hypothetical protein
MVPPTEALRLALRDLGDASPADLTAHMERRSGVKVRPQFLPLLRASLLDQEWVAKAARKGAEAAAAAAEGVEAKDQAAESVQTWVKLNGCDTKPTTETISKAGDELRVTRTTYGGGKGGAEVVLVTVEGGGHTWPGRPPPVAFLGKSAMNVSANDLLWEFFRKHARK